MAKEQSSQQGAQQGGQNKPQPQPASSQDRPVFHGTKIRGDVRGNGAKQSR